MTTWKAASSVLRNIHHGHRGGGQRALSRQGSCYRQPTIPRSTRACQAQPCTHPPTPAERCNVALGHGCCPPGFVHRGVGPRPVRPGCAAQAKRGDALTPHHATRSEQGKLRLLPRVPACSQLPRLTGASPKAEVGRDLWRVSGPTHPLRQGHLDVVA